MPTLIGLVATSRRLAAEERRPSSSFLSTARRPHRVANRAPAAAARTATTASNLLLDGSLKALPNRLPDQAKNTTISTTCTRAPARLLRPTAATEVVGSTPDFWR